jgi:hypothetical protein
MEEVEPCTVVTEEVKAAGVVKGWFFGLSSYGFLWVPKVLRFGFEF